MKEKKAVVLLNKTDLEAVTTEESLVEKLREAGVDKTEITDFLPWKTKGLNLALREGEGDVLRRRALLQ